MQTANNIKTHYLFPSNIYIAMEPTLVTTVLGSCVSVCLFDQQNQLGAINHFMLPLWNGNGLASPKYGNIAMDRIINGLVDFGGQKEKMVAKIFGGANQTESSLNIGERNIQIAFDLLKKYGIKVVAHSTGGNRGRKIIYNTFTGEVRMKMVGK